PDQTAFLVQLYQSDPTVATAFTLAQAFGQLLRGLEGSQRLEHWKAAVRASGNVEPIGFVDGLADDAEAVANGCTVSWSNGIVEGFINKVKWIKRSSYGQAGFSLLHRRVRLASGCLGTIGQRSETSLLPKVCISSLSSCRLHRVHTDGRCSSKECLTNGCHIRHLWC